MCREKNNALGDIESKSQLHSKWLKEITEVRYLFGNARTADSQLNLISAELISFSLFFYSSIAWYWKNPGGRLPAKKEGKNLGNRVR